MITEAIAGAIGAEWTTPRPLSTMWSDRVALEGSYPTPLVNDRGVVKKAPLGLSRLVLVRVRSLRGIAARAGGIAPARVRRSNRNLAPEAGFCRPRGGFLSPPIGTCTETALSALIGGSTTAVQDEQPAVQGSWLSIHFSSAGPLSQLVISA